MPDSDTTLISVARRLHAILGDEHSVVVGGVCANAYGVSRLTRDVDLATDLSADAVIDAMRHAGMEVQKRTGASDDPLPWVVAGRLEGVPFQVLPGHIAGDPAKAIRLDEIGLRVLPLAAFVRSKLRAGSWKDLYDIGWLCLRYPRLLPHAQVVAAEYGHAKALDRVLADERLRAQFEPEDGTSPRA